MRKKELIKALSKIEDGIADLKNLMISEEQRESDKEEQSAPEEKEVKAEATTPTEEGAYSVEELNAMKYNDLKKLGKSLGVKCTGTRDEITNRILGASVEAEPDKEEEEEPVKETEKESNVVPIKGKTSKKKKSEPEEDDNSDSDVEEQYLELAREALEDNTLEEVAEVLADAGIKLNKMQAKKKDVLMLHLAQAFQNGLIDVDSDDDAEEGPEDDSTEDDSFSEDSYFPQYDPDGVNNPDSMTADREKAVHKMVAGLIEKYEAEELTVEEMESELEDIITDDDVELLGEDYDEEELFAFYIEVKKRFVDNEGNIIEPGDPYEIGEHDFCCGHELNYDKKNKKYVCEVCGEEYEE